jgi:hypothetical protein
MLLAESESPRPGRRALILCAAAAVSLAALAVVLTLGAWAYNYRRLSMHEGRLANLVKKKPSVSITSQGLTNEGWTAVAVDADDATLLKLFGSDPPPRVAEVRAKRARWPTARLFAHDDLVYVLYFDADGKASDFSLLKR